MPSASRNHPTFEQTVSSDFFAALSEPVVIVDKKGVIRHANEHIPSVFERSVDSLVGTAIQSHLSVSFDFHADILTPLSETTADDQLQLRVGLRKTSTKIGITAVSVEDGVALLFAPANNNPIVTNAINHREEMYRTLIESFPNGTVHLYDDSLRFTLSEGQLFSEIDYEPSDFIGKTLDEVFETSVYEKLKPVYQSAIEGRSESIELDVPADDRSYRVISSPVRNDAGAVVQGMVVTQDITSEIEMREQLEREEKRFHELATHIDEVFWISTPDKSKMLYVSPAYADIWGRSCESLLNDAYSFLDNVHPDDRDRINTAIEKQTQREYDEEYRIVRPDGSIRWVRDQAFLVREAGEIVRIVGTSKDITTRKQYEQTLTSLHDATQEMMSAETTVDIARITVTAASTILNHSLAGCYLFDPTSYQLYPASVTDDATEYVQGPVSAEDGDSVAWRAFENNAVEIEEQVSVPSVVDGSTTLFNYIVAIPVGNDGVLTVGSTEDTPVNGERMQLAELLCANAAAAMARFEREETLRQRERTLETRNEELERLHRITEVTRSVTNTLVRSNTRTEIEQSVCATLAGTRTYQFARMLRYDRIEAALTEVETAGIDRRHTTTDVDTTARALRAAQTATTVVESDIVGSVSQPRRRHALRNRYGSVAAVPLLDGSHVYGVLEIFADRANAFGSRERDALSEVGETIGYAIASTERHAAMISDELVEVSFTISDPESIFAQFAQAVNGTITHSGLIALDDGTSRIFVTVETTEHTTNELLSRLTDFDRVSHATVLLEDPKPTVAVHVTNIALFDVLLAHSGALISLTANTRGFDATVSIPSATLVSDFISEVGGAYDSFTLTAKQQREHPPRSIKDFQTALRNELSTRELDILQTAYISGYFETPRAVSGSELAERLDITASTFHRTLRRGLKSMLDASLTTSSE